MEKTQFFRNIINTTFTKAILTFASLKLPHSKSTDLSYKITGMLHRIPTFDNTFAALAKQFSTPFQRFYLLSG
jgi:hypothetical protein